MDHETKLKEIIASAASKIGIEVKPEEIVIDHAREKAHGDFATNTALRYAKALGKNPREVAEALIKEMNDPMIEKIEIAGPGFINFFLKQESLASIVKTIITEGKDYGRAPRSGKSICLEYVSANPTGDLHLGHTRCAAVGDSIAKILDAAGFDVTKEFYVNDCGNQVEHLGHSLRARYHELFGEPLQLDDDDYHGVDLIDIAKKIKDLFGDKYLTDNDESHDFFIRFGIDEELAKLKKDLSDFGVTFDKFSYESDIRKDGNVEKTISFLKEKGYIYEKDGASFLKTTSFLDDKDRPVVKSNGLFTYFMPDICYHYNKMSRGFDHLIDVLGADHHGYLNRMKSALMMKGYKEDVLDFVLVQVVRVYKNGEEVKMSKRTGKAIAHRDLVEEVGKDAVRYFFVERNQSTHLDFNYNLATEQSSNNPVYYAQYAHARCCSIMELGKDFTPNMDAPLLQEEAELSILKHLSDFPSMIVSSAETRSPNRVAAYIHRLAELFHEFYGKCRVVDPANKELTESRLALIKSVQITLENALALIGVSAPTKM